MIRRCAAIAAAALALAPVPSCAQPAGDYALEVAFPALEFRRPVDIQRPPDGTNRLFVVEQDGTIRVFAANPAVEASTVFLDVRERVSTAGNEMGLLGLAFAPDFGESRYFFVYYTADGDSGRVGRVSRFSVAADAPDLGDPDSEEVVLEVLQPWSNHNGGQVAFGPDGYLYLGLGDGGAGGDPRGNGQNPRTLLGSILRIDVSQLPYAIPPDNPFAGNELGYREEVWAYGLRNPWRFSFDPDTGTMWAGDVGQVTWEEIDIIEKGHNYGWDCREGYHAYQPANERSPACSEDQDLTPPVWVYGRDRGKSVTGGHVYRGARLASLAGRYVYADYVSGRVWALYYDGTKAENRLLADSDILISAFGVDDAGELLLCAHDPRGGATHLYRLVAGK